MRGVLPVVTDSAATPRAQGNAPTAQSERVPKAIDEWYTSVYYAHKVSVPSPLRDRLAELIIRRLWLEDVRNEGSGA